MNNAVEITAMNKSFKDLVLFRDAELTIPSSGIVGLMGENGSGKSVLLKIICGLILADSGKIIVNGELVQKGKIPYDIGIALDQTGFLPHETAFKNLADIAGIRRKISRDEIRDSLRQVGLDPDSKVKVGDFSLGMKKRLAIAQAVMERPSLLLLDEPFNAIDRKWKGIILELLREMNETQGTTILITSHNTDELHALCGSLIYTIDSHKIQ